MVGRQSCSSYKNVEGKGPYREMKRILVVDDESLLLRGFDKALHTDSTEVTTVESGEAALSEIASSHFHLCFLDIFLPGMDGAEVLKKIATISPKTKVVMMTAGVINDAMVQTIERNAHMFITKPFDLLQVKMIAKSIADESE
jgi:DNA-binding NtrC family response regulator